MAIHLGRRELIVGLGGAAAGAAIGSAAVWIYAARAQPVRALQLKILQVQANAAANEIAAFIREIAGQAAWLTHLPWSAATFDEWRFDVARMFRQVPAITEVFQLDAQGREQARVSRFAPDVFGSQDDFSQDPAFIEARANKIYYGPVFFLRDSEPYMTLAMASVRREYGVIVVKINIKLVWDVIQTMGVGHNGATYIVDAQDRVIAHSDLSMLVVRDADGRPTGRSVERKFSDAARLNEARVERSGAKLARDSNGREILAAHAAVGPGELGWMLFAEVPVEEAGVLA